MNKETVDEIEIFEETKDLMDYSISIIIPTLNEEAGIAIVLDEINQYLDKIDYVMIVVDGRSADKTREVSKKMGAKIIIEDKKGYGRAIKTGILNAKTDFICVMDGDGTYPVDIIPFMIKKIHEQEDVFITTNRFAYIDKKSMSLIHRLGNIVLTLTMNILFNSKLKDSQSGMWIFKTNIRESILPEADDMSFSQEIKIRALQKYQVIEVPIIYRERIGEVKLNTFRDGINNLIALFKLKMKLINH